MEDRLRLHVPQFSYTEGPELAHGRIETRTYRIYDGLEIIADNKKWGGRMSIIEYEADTFRKSTGVRTQEKRLYVTSLPAHIPRPGSIVRIRNEPGKGFYGQIFILNERAVKMSGIKPNFFNP